MKITRRTKLLIVALVLCMTTMIGSTLAWFTDTVESGINTIESGNLDIELAYWDGDSYEAVTNTTKLFKENILWEPGHTEVAYLKITNAGNLALKYVLDVNVADEKTGTNVAGETFKLSDYLTAKVVEGKNAAAGVYNRADAVAATAGIIGQEHQMTTQGAVDYVALVVYMPTTVGNEANPKTGTPAPTVTLGVKLNATQLMFESDSFGKDYDENAMIVVKTAAEAQAALDAATPGAVIKLAPGVEYGTLYLRPVAGQANTITDCNYLVYGNEMLRKVENITIVGAPGATVDAIKVVAGHIEGSTGYVVDIQNLVIDSVEFNDDYTNPPHSYAAPVFFDLTYTNVNGLTVKNCKLIGNNATMNFVYLYGSGRPTNSTFETAAKNITITGNTVDGIARLCELRQAENVTITNNTIKNTALHGMLLAVDGGTYAGNVTITGNTAENINERFVRMAGAGDAVVVIKDNTIVNYMGADSNYIKVTDGNNVTIENNAVSVGVKDADALKTAMANGGTIVLVKDITLDDTVTVPSNVTAILDLAGHTISQTKACTDSYSMIANNGTLTITGNGKLSFKDTGAGDPNFDWGSYTVRNEGTLVVENGTIEHLGEQDFATHCIMAIYQYSGSTTIKGGTISCPNYRSVRLWKGNMTINGGEFTGQIWCQAVDNTAKLTINGGSFAPVGNDASSVFVENATHDVEFSVTDGNFATKIGCSNADKLVGCITGGNFSNEAKANTNAKLFATN